MILSSVSKEHLLIFYEILIKEMMSEAIRLRTGDLPTPGIISEPYSLALSVCKNIDATSIEIVGNSNNLSICIVGSIEESFTNALQDA